ncbi:MAG: sulfotransferase [Bacteroidia bacterium]
MQQALPIIFVTGYSRSGTTMMARIISRNEPVHAFHEMHFFEQLWMPSKERKNISHDEGVLLVANMMSIHREGYLMDHHPENFLDDAKKMLEDYKGEYFPPMLFKHFLFSECKLNNKSIPVDQTTRNTLFLTEILQYYPEARVICMVRDPRDVLLSQKRKWKRKFLGGSSIPLRESIRAYINYHPITISKLWNAAATRIAAIDHPQVLKIKFEELLQQPEAIIRKICAFTGLEFDEKMLKVPHVGSSNATDKGDKQGINAEKTGNYKDGLNDTEIYLSQKVTRKNRQHFNYADEQVKVNPILLIGYCFILPVKLSIALLLSLSRTKNLWATIKRRL